MDKKEATLTLTERLQEMGYVYLITDTAIKSYLLENAKSSVLDLRQGDPQIFAYDKISFKGYAKSEEFLEIKEKCPWANYLFAEGKKMKQNEALCDALITPAAIIGKEEIKILKNKYYKDVQYNVREALETLKIPSFIEFYETYSSIDSKKGDGQELDLKDIFIAPYQSASYMPFKEGDTVEIGDIVQGRQSLHYYLVKNVKKNYNIS